MTDINVSTIQHQVERRSWYLGTAETPGFTLNGALDVSAFTLADHFPNGFLPSGIVLGRITATGKYGPYLAAAGDGRGDAAGILFSAAKVPNLADLTRDVGCAVLVAFAPVAVGKLPIADTVATGGFLDAAAQADLSRLYFVPAGA